jgi:glycosyltransferase involved in cell wall biosynthesis
MVGPSRAQIHDQEELVTSTHESRLRIGMVAPPWHGLPPSGYGGIEAMVYWLVQGLAARGHDLTVISAGQDQTDARSRRTYTDPPSARIGQALPEVVHAAAAERHLEELDVDLIHDHSLVGPLLSIGRPVPTVVTAHGPVEGDLGAYYRLLGPGAALVAISQAQRELAPDLGWVATVHNAVPVDDYPFRDTKEDFCLFLGRINHEKAPDLAIQAARSAGYRIVLAAKCSEPEEQRYFDERVRPLLGPDTEWLGQADSARKQDMLARARCLVFPIQWNEPFGLVMIEAMACGTPVVAIRRGAAAEVVEDRVTGFLRDDLDELPAAIQRAGELDPLACRRRAAERFDLPVMVDGYEAVYQRLTR